MDDAQINFFKTAKKALSTPGVLTTEVESANTIFGKYVSAELDPLPTEHQRIARHEIGNLLFNIQTRTEQSYVSYPRLRQHPNPITNVNTIKLNSRCLYHRVLQIHCLLILVVITIPTLHTVTQDTTSITVTLVRITIITKQI